MKNLTRNLFYSLILVLLTSSNIFGQTPGSPCYENFPMLGYMQGVIDCEGNCFPNAFGLSVDLSPCSGCTDNSALNYDPNVVIEDGSCITVVSGCMDSTALNYNSEANTDDGSCVAEPTPGTACSYTTTSEGFMPVSCPSSSCNGSTCSYQPMLGYVCFPPSTYTVSGTYDCNGNLYTRSRICFRFVSVFWMYRY